MKENQRSLLLALLSVACLVLVGVLGTSAPLRAEGKLFAIVAKSTADTNFVKVYEGALAEAVQNGDRVLFVGGNKEAHFRIQDAAVSIVLRRKLDGLAISVLHSKYLAENSFVEVSRACVPVVTFDSDFTGQYVRLRAGYVGTDNVDLGRVLGREVSRLHPGGGRFVILTGGPDDTNLNNRIQGVLDVLKDGNWTQHRRSPLPCRDNYDQALKQLEAMMQDPTVDAIISVGWWAQMAKGYEPVMSKYREVLDSRDKILVFAGAAVRQRQMLDKGLNHVNVGLNFEGMGREVYRVLSRLAGGKSIPPETWTPMKVYRSESAEQEP